VARVLIVGCGCRGQALARELRAEGHAVRGTTREEGRREAIAASGAEPWVADPDRVVTLMPALAQVTVVCWLLGAAAGPSAADVHGPRLRMALEKMVDTPVRAVLYEPARGPADVRAAGLAIAREAAATWRIPLGVLEAPADDHVVWAEEARRGVEALLEPSAWAG
jgi:glycine/D-amino acid oxidase-like deaminating enzyme